MIRARFKFMWRNFHPSYDETDLEDIETTLDEEDKTEDKRESILDLKESKEIKMKLQMMMRQWKMLLLNNHPKK